MTEKEKMQQGLLYDANYDEELLAVRAKCKDLCFAYNQIPPSQTRRQEELIRQLLGKMGSHVCITAPFWCDYGYNITVGDNVWFGASVTVLPGVTIGSNTVIGAGSLVNRDIPDGVVAVGNPCRVLRKITEEDKKKYWRNKNGL